MSDTTPRSALPLLAAAQAQKHVTHNEALLQLDALAFARFLDRDLTAPPSTPADGDTYLVKATATGLWAGQNAKIAFALDGAWRFYAPFTGLGAYVVDEMKLIVYDGSAWIDYAAILALQNVPLLGVNATADATNKLSVASSAILFNHIGAGVQAKLNKNAVGDTASLLYQTGFSGRAELGLTGDDDFHLKVSPDGSTWHEGVRVAKSTGVAFVNFGFSAGAIPFGDPAATGGLSSDTAKLFWDSTNGYLLVGSSPAAPDAPLTINKTGAASIAPPAATGLHIVGTSASGRNLNMDNYGSNALFFVRRAQGTAASPTAVTSGLTLFSFSCLGHDGTNFTGFTTAGINFVADENFTTTARGGRIDWRLTPTGTATTVTSGSFFGDGRFSFIGARLDQSYSYQTPATGFAITIANACERLILNPAGTLAAGTITMPAAPKDGQLCRIASTQIVTSLTFSPNTGQSIAGALTTIAANGFAEYTYRNANTTWYRTG